MPQEEKVRKRPRDSQEPQEDAGKKAKREQIKKKHEEILKDLEDVIEEADKQRQRGRKGGQ